MPPHARIWAPTFHAPGLTDRTPTPCPSLDCIGTPSCTHRGAAKLDIFRPHQSDGHFVGALGQGHGSGCRMETRVDSVRTLGFVPPHPTTCRTFQRGAHTNILTPGQPTPAPPSPPRPGPHLSPGFLLFVLPRAVLRAPRTNSAFQVAPFPPPGSADLGEPGSVW